ncbi:MAG: sialate O-acetylesterase, partial [Planctomycetota bacterium]
MFGDHMVLPPSTMVVVQGSGGVGKKVVVQPSWGGLLTCDVAKDGRWQVEITTPQRGLSGTLSVRSAGLEVVVEDILIGDVWLASGQSNMEMTVGAAGGWKTGV